MFQAADYLEQAEYDTGNSAEDLKAQSLMKQLLYNQKLRAACPLPFDEAKLWQGQSGPELMQHTQKQFRNIRYHNQTSQNVLDCHCLLRINSYLLQYVYGLQTLPIQSICTHDMEI